MNLCKFYLSRSLANWPITTLAIFLSVRVGGFEPPMFTLWEQIYSLLLDHHPSSTLIIFAEVVGVQPTQPFTALALFKSVYLCLLGTSIVCGDK